MIRAVALAVLFGACGRVGFDSTSEQCKPTVWSPELHLLENISVDDANDWEPTVSPDGLTIVWVTYRASNEGQLYVATRTSIEDEFSKTSIHLIPGFGSATTDVFGPTWSIDGTKLYFTIDTQRVAPYLGNGQFGAAMDSDIPVDQFTFAAPDEVFSTEFEALDDYDLLYHKLVGGNWVPQTLPAAYVRHGSNQSDAWPTFDRGRQDLYWEHDESGAYIARAHRDEGGPLPAQFEVLTDLGDDFSDPDLSADGLRMYVGSTRREGTDNDIYMLERVCE